MRAEHRSLWQRAGDLAGAVPELASALACLVTWMAPLALRPDAVKLVVSTLLLEFFLCIAGVFFTLIALDGDDRLGSRLLGMAIVMLMCLILSWLVAGMFGVASPIWLFLWLALGKSVWLFTDTRRRAQALRRNLGNALFPLATYAAAVLASATLPLPRLGITAELVPALELGDGRGLWFEQPHVAAAALSLHYLACAVWRACGGWPQREAALSAGR